MSASPEAKLLGFLHQLHQKKHLHELQFFMTNETKQAIPYQSAAYFEKTLTGKSEIKSLSGVTKVDRHTPQAQHIEHITNHLIKAATDKPTLLMEDIEQLDPELLKDWPHLGHHICLMLFYNKHDEVIGGLILFGTQTFESIRNIAQYLSTAYGDKVQAFKKERKVKQKYQDLTKNKRRAVIIAAIVVIVIFCFPIRMSVLAKAQIIPKNPDIIAAPLQGVIQHIYPRPNSEVTKGTILFSYDKTKLKNELMIAKRQYHVAKAKYRGSVQQGFADNDSRNNINALRFMSEKAQSEANYARALLKQSDVKAASSGILIYSNKNDWIGRPVELGEKIMMIAKQDQKEFEIWLPVDETINFKTGDPVVVFPNNSPLSSIDGVITHTSFDAQMTPENVLAYRLTAKINGKANNIRFGEQGTAKVYGERVSLIYYLFRRPISALRQTLGW